MCYTDYSRNFDWRWLKFLKHFGTLVFFNSYHFQGIVVWLNLSNLINLRFQSGAFTGLHRFLCHHDFMTCNSCLFQPHLRQQSCTKAACNIERSRRRGFIRQSTRGGLRDLIACKQRLWCPRCNYFSLLFY